MKPVLVGLNNPHSTDPARALGTQPPQASGFRLWSMLWEAGGRLDPILDISEEDYEAGFDRYNLVDEKHFDPIKFTIDRRAQVREKLNDRVVVLCGTNVPRWLGLSYSGFHLKPEPVVLSADVGFTYYTIPHPSGLCREYNDPDMRRRVGDLLLMLYKLGQSHE